MVLEVFAQKYDSSGTALSGNFLVNQTVFGDQGMASVAMLDTDNFVFVWSGEGSQAGQEDTSGVFARQYGTSPSAFNAPTNIAPDAFVVNEHVNTTGGTSVGVLTASDPDSGETFSYSIVGGPDLAKFTIGGAGDDELMLDDGVLDFETTSSYYVVVRVTDSDTNTYDELITVGVNDLNDAPTINNQSFSVDENSSVGTSVGNVAATDTDPEFGYTRLYWVDVDTDELRRVNLNGTDNQLLASQPDGTQAAGTRGVAVDGVNGKIYWSNNNSNEIWQADLDGGNATPIVTGLNSPHGMAVDAVSGKIFWIDNVTTEIWSAEFRW